MRADGRYFRARSAHFVDAQASLADKIIHFTEPHGNLLAEFPMASIKATARLGNVTRKLYLPDGGCFETRDNDAIDDMLKISRRNPMAGFLHRLEMSWKMVAFSVLAAAGVVAFMALVGVPAIARDLAEKTPPSIATLVADQTLATMDKLVLKPTKLKPDRVAALRARLVHITKFMPPTTNGYRLLLRDAPGLANAFALPDGRVVITDQLVALSKVDDELEGVMGHEISHVVHRHGLQRVYQASLVPAIMAFISGDASQLSHSATLLPGLMLQSSYSKTFEQQADDDAAAAMKRAGLKPSHLADLLERIEQKYCGKDGCKANWLGDHPNTDVRAAKLRGN